MLAHLQPSPATGPDSLPAAESAPSPSLPQHVQRHSEVLQAAARRAARGSATDAQSSCGLTPDQLQRRMRRSIADLLLDEDEGG